MKYCSLFLFLAILFSPQSLFAAEGDVCTGVHPTTGTSTSGACTAQSGCTRANILANSSCGSLTLVCCRGAVSTTDVCTGVHPTTGAATPGACVTQSNCTGANILANGSCGNSALVCCKGGASTAGACTAPNTCISGFACPSGASSAIGICANGSICCQPGSSGSTAIPNPKLNYTLLEKIPGIDSKNLSFSAYLSAVYKLAIWIVGLCALFMFLVGAFMYMLSAANTSKVGSAKSIMQDALIGLILALASYLILYVINPDLVNLRLPSVSMPSGGGARSTAPPTTSGAAAGATPSDACSGCIPIPSSVPNKGCGGGPCQLNAALLEKIQRISGISGWRITESYPPTVSHESSCHRNGTCADINNSGGATDPATIKRYYDAFKAAGLDVLYESKGCDPYIQAGVTNCKTYSTMTNASSFHVK